MLIDDARLGKRESKSPQTPGRFALPEDRVRQVTPKAGGRWEA